jgi:hypothetical protein
MRITADGKRPLVETVTGGAVPQLVQTVAPKT